MPVDRQLGCLSFDQAERVAWIIEDECGPAYLAAFVQYLTEPVQFGHEWRFGGTLGFGGKFHFTPTGRAYVSCYPEDETPEVLDAIDRTNERIKEALSHG